MAGRFREYERVLIDASFFRISDSEADSRKLLEELDGSKLCVSGVFLTECREYAALLPEDQRTRYLRLERDVRKNEPRLCAGKDGVPLDTWDAIVYFIEQGKKILVVTADRLLIQRLILENPAVVDLYDLNRRELIPSESFPDLRDETEFQERLLPDVPELTTRVTTNTRLFRAGKPPITLTERVTSGAESALFLSKEDEFEDIFQDPDDSGRDDEAEWIAKIFKRGRLTPEKYKNLRDLTTIARTIRRPWVIFPADILFLDEALEHPVGVLENYYKSGELLAHNRLYLGNLELLSQRDKEKRLSDSVRLCRDVVRQVCWLNRLGFFIADYNLKNFSVSQNGEYVVMFDTDSFGYGQYFGGVFAGDDFSREYDLKKKSDAIAFCDEALYIFVFSLLSLGDSPILASKEGERKFKYSDSSYPAYWHKQLFPKDLWNLFDACFTGRRRFSPEILLFYLSASLGALEKESRLSDRDFDYEDFKYGERLKNILSKKSVPANRSARPKKRGFKKYKKLSFLDSFGLPLLALIFIAIAVVITLLISGGTFFGVP